MFLLARYMFRFFAFISASCFFSAVSIADDIQCSGIGGPTNPVAYSLSPTEINGPIQKQKLFQGLRVKHGKSYQWCGDSKSIFVGFASDGDVYFGSRNDVQDGIRGSISQATSGRILENGRLILQCGDWSSGDRFVWQCDKGASYVAAALAAADSTEIAVSTAVAVQVGNGVVAETAQASVTTVGVAADISVAQTNIDNLEEQIVLFSSILLVLEKRELTRKEKVLAVISDEVKRLTAQKKALQAMYEQQFLTPIRPQNINLNQTSFRAAEIFPRVPFYIPGSEETGVLHFRPIVTNTGELEFNLSFVDPIAEFEKVRDQIKISAKSVSAAIAGLDKILEWTEIAEENAVTRRLEKRASCLSEPICPSVATGVYSSELLFQTYENGSTSGKFQINKGNYSFGYNVSVESAILLSAYLTYMDEIGRKDFDVRSMSDDQVLDLFD